MYIGVTLGTFLYLPPLPQSPPSTNLIPCHHDHDIRSIHPSIHLTMTKHHPSAFAHPKSGVIYQII